MTTKINLKPMWVSVEMGLALLCFSTIIALMKCVVKTTNLARLTYLQSVLTDFDIPFFVFDHHISALEAGIGAFPRRLMVPDDYEAIAIRRLQEVEEYYDE